MVVWQNLQFKFVSSTVVLLIFAKDLEIKASSRVLKFTGNNVMNDSIPLTFSAMLRSDLRVYVIILLLVYNMYSYSVWKQYSMEHKEALSGLNLLYQMRDYARDKCQISNGKLSDVKLEESLKVRKGHKRTDVTKDTVEKEVTFILVGPAVRCLRSNIAWLKARYARAKVLISIDAKDLSDNEHASFNTFTSNGVLLGRFDDTPAALNHAIQLVITKYFMIIDHKMDLANMRDNFIEVFVSNMPGYDIMSGSIVNTLGEFTIPCKRLQMKRWAYYEKFQYNVSGNILDCDATSLNFIARHEVLARVRIFDENLKLKWLEDFFYSQLQDLKVGVLPEIILRQKVLKNCEKTQVSTSKETELLLPFAKKHQLFYLSYKKRHINICKDVNSLACSENGIQRTWGIKHWTDKGFSTYPFIIESLENALHFGTRRLEESGLMYVIEGGTLLGMVKLRDILPWDHGDIDTFVYATRRKVIDMVKQSLRKYGYEHWLRHTGFHTYVTNDATSLNGCIVYLTRRVKPKAVVYMRHRDKLLPVKRDLFRFLRQFYGSLFLENHMKFSNQRSYCFKPGHHACMPDCRWDGCGGGLK